MRNVQGVTLNKIAEVLLDVDLLKVYFGNLGEMLCVLCTKVQNFNMAISLKPHHVVVGFNYVGSFLFLIQIFICLYIRRE